MWSQSRAEATGGLTRRGDCANMRGGWWASRRRSIVAWRAWSWARVRTRSGCRVICPYCNVDDDKVIDSRASDGGKSIRRRRECLGCTRRFTTYERVEVTTRLMVVKRDGTHEPFSRENVMRGVVAACGKRPIPEAAKSKIVDEVEEELHREFDREVESRVIGERVMAKLRDVDEVAYIRFASEYYQFRSVAEIRQQLALLDARVKDVKDQQKLF